MLPAHVTGADEGDAICLDGPLGEHSKRAPAREGREVASKGTLCCFKSQIGGT